MKGGLKWMKNAPNPQMGAIKSKVKEWDSRFYLERIPEYDPLEDVHCRNYAEIIKKSGKALPRRRPHALLAPGGLRVNRPQHSVERQADSVSATQDPRPNPISRKGARHKKRELAVGPERVASLQCEILELWSRARIDKHYQDGFLRSVADLPPKVFIQLVAKEVENLHNEKTVMQQLLANIHKREECIRILKLFVGCIERTQDKTELKEQAGNALEGMRNASLAVVESAVQFREQLKTGYVLSGSGENIVCAEKFPILINGINYLVKMKSDTVFLAETDLAKWFNFSRKSDPFLVSLATPYALAQGASKKKQLEALRAQGKQGIVAIPISSAQMERVKNAEVVLLEEALWTHGGNCGRDSSTSELSVTPNKGMRSSRLLNVHQESCSKLKASVGEQDVLTSRSEHCLRPLGIDQRNIMYFLQEYEKGLSLEMRESFVGLKELVAKVEKGGEPYWLGYFSASGTIHGLAVFSIDTACKLKTRVTIYHASTKEKECELREFLHKLTSFIWESVCCDEQRVEIVNLRTESGEYAPYDLLKRVFTELQFKWKNISNDDNGRRILVLGVNRPPSCAFLNPRSLDLDIELVSFKHSVALFTGASTPGATSCNAPSAPISLCSYLNALLELHKSGCIDDAQTSALADCLLGSTAAPVIERLSAMESYQLPATKQACAQDLSQISEIHESLKMGALALPRAENYAIGVQSVALKWGSYEFATHSGYNYVRIKSGFVFSTTSEYSVALISGDDDGVNVLIAVPKEGRVVDQHLWEEIKKITAELEPDDAVDFEEVWIPGFNLNGNYSWDVSPALSPQSAHATDSSHCRVYCPKSHGGGLGVSDSTNKFVVSSGFIFALMHSRLEEDFGIPLMLAYIPPAAWDKQF